MKEEDARYLRHGYVFLFAAIPPMLSLLWTWLKGIDFETSWTDWVLNTSSLSTFLWLGLLAAKRINYSGVILFQLADFFWYTLAATFLKYFLFAKWTDDELVKEILWHSTTNPYIIAFGSNPFRDILAAQLALFLVIRYDVFLRTKNATKANTLLLLYRFCALIFLVRAFEHCYFKFNGYLLTRFYHQFNLTWALIIAPLFVLGIIHLLLLRYEKSANLWPNAKIRDSILA